MSILKWHYNISYIPEKPTNNPSFWFDTAIILTANFFIVSAIIDNETDRGGRKRIPKASN